MDEPDAVAGEWARANAEVIAEVAREVILIVRRHRFLSGTLIPHEFVEALDAETDVDQLKRWFDEALRAFSLKDFLLGWRASLDGGHPGENRAQASLPWPVERERFRRVVPRRTAFDSAARSLQ